MTPNEKIEYQFTATNSQLKKVVKDNIKMLEKYGDTVLKVAKKDKNLSGEEYEKLSEKIKKTADVAAQYEKAYVHMSKATQQAIQRTLKTQAQAAEQAKRLADKQVREAERRTKALAKLRQQQEKALELTQNRENASLKGTVNVDAPAISAADSASVFQQFFSNQSSNLGGMFAQFAGFKQGTGVITQNAAAWAALGVKVRIAVEVLKKVYSTAKQVVSVVAKLTQGVLKFVTTPLRAFYGGMNNLRESVFSVNGALEQFTSILGIGAGVGLGTLLSNAAQNASNMAESINLFRVAMKNSLHEGNVFIANLSEMSGMDATKLMDITGLFYEMGAAIEMPHDSAAKLSKDLTALSLDISSLFNMDLETVTSNLTSGIRGMSRAVIKYGMDLRATTVEAFARSELGMTEQFETMNETNRVILRYLVMLKQAQDSNGDFALTIENPANQLRVFKEQILGVSREMGRFIVNVLKPALPVINGFAMALRQMLKFTADFLSIWNGLDDTLSNGGGATKEVEDNIDGIGESATSATKAMKKLLAPFDELNILSQNSGGASSSATDYGVADPRLLQALEEAETRFGKIAMKAHEVRDAILEFFGFEYVFDADNNLEEYVKPIPGSFADKLIKAFQAKDFGAVGAVIAEKFNELLQPLVEKFSWENIKEEVTEKLSAWITGINAFIKTFDWLSLGRLLGNMIKSAVEAIDFLLLNFDWSELGKAISATLNGYIEAFDFSEVGRVLAHWLTAVAQFAASAAKDFNWVEFGQQVAGSINKFFENWDAVAIGEAANSIIMGLINMAKTAVEKTDWATVGNEIAKMLKALDWPSIFKGLGSVMLSALKGAITGAASFDRTYRALTVNNPFSGNANSRMSDEWLSPYLDTAMATGGVVTAPTRALIGEAGRSEAVIPLDNSPQMQNFISQIVDAIGATNNRPVEARVYLDGKSLSRALYNDMQSEGVRRGKSLVTTSR